MTEVRPNTGELLRNWRMRRRMPQSDLAYDADISSRHLSFIENGRARASSPVLLRLADCLQLPLRVRNQLLLSAGFAPVYSTHGLSSADLAPIRDAIDTVLTAQMPFPALVIDRRWDVVMANPAVDRLLAPLSPAALRAPVNILRLSLHPDGLAPYIENFVAWRGHLLSRFRHQMERTGDSELRALYEECLDYGGPDALDRSSDPPIVVPLRLRLPGIAATLSFISTTMLFGAPHDVTLEELAIECFFPADIDTRRHIESAPDA